MARARTTAGARAISMYSCRASARFRLRHGSQVPEKQIWEPEKQIRNRVYEKQI